MAKRKFTDPFGESNSSDNDALKDVKDVADVIYGDSSILQQLTDDARVLENLKAINIFRIYPDPTQPRRTIPSLVRESWDHTPDNLPEMFALWEQAVREERGTDFDIVRQLERAESEIQAQGESIIPATPGYLEASLRKIIDLAASIRASGLTNPITVFKQQDSFMLETGERRWLAFHLLHTVYNGHDERPDETARWRMIPAREFSMFDRWRQATENNVRADLNAIGRARQWALLVMSLADETVKPIESFKSERLFYRQALKIKTYGEGDRIRSTLGISSRSTISMYRALLSLPDEIWQIADDQNIAEEPLYKTAQQSTDEEKIAYFYKNVLGQNISNKSAADQADDYTPGTKRHFMTLSKLLRNAENNKPEQNAKALRYLRELRQWLEEEEQRVLRL